MRSCFFFLRHISLKMASADARIVYYYTIIILHIYTSGALANVFVNVYAIISCKARAQTNTVFFLSKRERTRAHWGVKNQITFTL